MTLPDISRAYQCPVTGRFLDPLKCRRELLAEPDVNAWIEADDHARLIPHARRVLALPDLDPVTGAGFTDHVVLTSLTLFTEYLQGKGERARTSPSSAPCSDCQGR